MILETRETARGLIVNLSDVLFDTGSAKLKPGAREKLARVAGILLAHPGLKIEIEGHTDSVGGDDYNQRLSERRAAVGARLPGAAGHRQRPSTAKGFGESGRWPVERDSGRTSAESPRRARRVRRTDRGRQQVR